MPAPPAAKWHPIVDAVEVEPGHWVLHEPRSGDYEQAPPRKYADVQMVKRGDEVGYRALMLGKGMERPVLVGYFRSTRSALENAHRLWVSSHGPGGGPYAHWG